MVKIRINIRIKKKERISMILYVEEKGREDEAEEYDKEERTVRYKHVLSILRET